MRFLFVVGVTLALAAMGEGLGRYVGEWAETFPLIMGFVFAFRAYLDERDKNNS